MVPEINCVVGVIVAVCSGITVVELLETNGILNGMLIDVEDCQGGITGKTIVDAYAGNLGTSVWFSDSKT